MMLVVGTWQRKSESESSLKSWLRSRAGDAQDGCDAPLNTSPLRSYSSISQTASQPQCSGLEPSRRCCRPVNILDSDLQKHITRDLISNSQELK